jgi:hypothetical protein
MTKRIIDRQYPLFAVKSLGIANIGAGNGVEFVVPINALVLRVGLQTVTAFDSGTTATGTIGDGTTTYVNAQDVKSTGAETSAGAPKLYPTGGTISATLAETGTTATAGEAIAYVEYVILDRGQEIQA